MNENFIMPSPVGNLYVESRGNTIIGLEYNTRKKSSIKVLSPQQKKIKTVIERYFSSSNQAFDFDLELNGTEFQRSVWKILRAIPAGQVKTYGEVAKKLNSSARAVGNACRANPIPLLVPCHRVVAQNGIGGFSGKRHGLTVERKRWLLRHEGVEI